MTTARSFLWGRLAPVLMVMLFCAGRGGAVEYSSTSWTALEDRAALVHVPAGTKRVRLQSRDAGTGAWSTVGIVHLEGRAGTVKLRLPDGVALENLSVEASQTDPFPHSYYQGKNSFDPAPSSATGGVRNGDLMAPGALADAEAGDPGSPAAVQESDIWKWRDRTLYYYNTLRGLQVFDLSDFERPRRVGGLRMPAVGEDMYLLGSEHVVLLSNRPDSGWESNSASGPRSEVVVVRHAGTVLAEVARVPIDGSFMESRMVGSTLCVVSQKIVTTVAPEGGLMYVPRQYVYAVDFSDPALPHIRGPLDVTNSDGAWTWQSVVHATSEFLFVATNSWESVGGTHTRLNAIDLRAPGQPLAVAAQFTLAGQLRHRFQIAYANGIVTTVTEAGGAVIETWDLPRAMLGMGPAAPVPLDSLMVGRNESLFATRFDGKRVYVVTFRRIDPLFCVDLADPADLRLLGELEVPGFSTYLEAFADGSRLLSLGVEESRVAVSLFDVVTPSAPTLKSRVYFGDSEHWSWSEGNYDDKAIGFFRSEGLLLFPLQQWSREHGYRTGMQLVDATADGLRARGFIDHQFSARRGRLFDQTLVSIGGYELFVLDVSNRDQPRKVSSLTVAWPVQDAVPYGDWVVQIEDGDQVVYNNDSNDPPRQVRLRLTSKSDLDIPVAELELGHAGQLAGTTVRGTTLYALVRSMEERSDPDAEGKPVVEWSTLLTTVIVDLAAPGGPRVAGAAPSRREGYAWSYGRLESHWLPDGRLLWYPPEASNNSFWWRCGMCAIDLVGDVAIGGGFLKMPWRWGGGQPEDMLVVDVADPATARVVAREAAVPVGDNSHSGRVFLSADNRLLASWSTWSVTDTGWIEQSFVQEIDLADTAAPRRGPMATVPALVQGVYRTGSGGLVLFASRQEILVNPDATTTWTNHSIVDALAYDGVQAFLLDTIRLEGAAQMPTVVFGPHFLVLQHSSDGTKGAALRLLALDQATGKWSVLPDIALTVRWPTLEQRGGYLFASDTYQTETIALHQLPATPARTTQPLEAPVWDQSALALDLPDRAAWLPVGSYGVERLDLRALPLPPASTPRAPRDRGVVEWYTLELLPVDVVSASSQDGGFAALLKADFRFAADGDAETFADWAERHFPDSWSAVGGAIGDPDHDGFDNYSEWAFGSSPTEAHSLPEVTAALMPTEPGQPPRLILVARLNPLADIDASGISSSLVLVPQLSTDLLQWRPLNDDEVETSVTPVRRLWTLPVPADASAAYGRLRVFFAVEG